MENANVTVISATMVLLSIVASITFYEYNDRRLLSKSIDLSISQNIDPMVVRCSYAKNAKDEVCINYFKFNTESTR